MAGWPGRGSQRALSLLLTSLIAAQDHLERLRLKREFDREWDEQHRASWLDTQRAFLAIERRDLRFELTMMERRRLKAEHERLVRGCREGGREGPASAHHIAPLPPRGAPAQNDSTAVQRGASELETQLKRLGIEDLAGAADEEGAAVKWTDEEDAVVCGARGGRGWAGVGREDRRGARSGADG